MKPTEIKKLRVDLGMTQEQLAQKIGVSWSTINRWENGKGKPHKVFVKMMEKMKKK